MKKKTKLIALIIAAILMIVGIGGAVFALIMESKAPAPAEKPENDTTAVVHADIEYVYDDKGELRSEIYYKDNVYNGQKDYYTADDAAYTTTFDKDQNEIASSKTDFNIVGSISYVTEYENHKLVKTVEYDYDDDLITLLKKTTKIYEGEDELAEKVYYANGKKTRICKYKNGTLTEDIFYDENGNTIENGGETVED